MEGQKISFMFKKTKKPDKPVAVNNDERKEYIDCVEEQSIKVVGGEAEKTNEPLVIPMKPNTLITSDRMLEIALKVETELEEPEIKTETIELEDPLAENETLDQMAVRELMQDARRENFTIAAPTMEIPTSTKGVAGGEKEMKAKALLKDTVVLLLDLIGKHKVIITKATDATTNRLKEDAWKAIAEEFYTLTGEVRRPEQLRLKWENLKKASRKRSAMIKDNNVKARGRRTSIPHNEVLDKVAALLAGSYSNYSAAEFSDESRNGVDPDPPNPEPVVDAIEQHEHESLPENSLIAQSLEVELDELSDVPTFSTSPPKFVFNGPKNSFNKRRKLSEDLMKAQTDKELAIAAYFVARTEKTRLENIKLELEIKALRKKMNIDH